MEPNRDKKEDEDDAINAYERLVQTISKVRSVAEKKLKFNIKTSNANEKKNKTNTSSNDNDNEEETMEEFKKRREREQVVLIELRRANREALLEIERIKKEQERKRKGVDVLKKKIMAIEYEKAHLDVEIQTREENLNIAQDAQRFSFVSDEQLSLMTKNIKYSTAEDRLVAERDMRKDLIKKIEEARKKRLDLELEEENNSKKKKDAENAINELKRTAAIFARQFESIR
jgi:hypothetical protein